EDGLTVTNTYAIPEEGTVEATKVWTGGSEPRPTIWFKLYRQIEGREIEEVPDAALGELADGTTGVEWTGLEETDEEGNEYIFSVKEVDEEGNDLTPSGYRKTKDDLTVTNRRRTPSPGPDPDPDPKDPEDPTAPTDSGDPGGQGEGLPKTGTSVHIAISILGVILVAAGFVLRRKIKQ